MWFPVSKVDGPLTCCPDVGRQWLMIGLWVARKSRDELDVASLLWTRGRDFPIAMLANRLRCRVCGSRKVSVRISIPGNTGAKRVGVGM